MKLTVLLPSLALVVATLPACADNFAWTTWTAATPGDATPGSATGTLASTLYGTIGVTYSGQTSGLATQPSWGPASTFTGGVVGNAPPPYNGLALEGGQTYAETITFSQAVTDPAFAIWSLGSGSVPAYFNFNAAEPFNLLGGGPSAEYGGQSIVIAGTAIDGSEGNGLVQFIGTYRSLTFTTPDYEGYYALTVGEDANLTDHPTPTPTPPATGVTPEPSSFALFGSGLLGVAGVMKRRFA